MARPANTNICVNCGLCCDGSYLTFVPLRNGDNQEALEKAGIALYQEKSSVCFDLPCPAYHNGICMVYNDRPVVCREYQCGLLIKHNNGRIDTANALTLIATTVRLRNEVRTALESLLNPGNGIAFQELLRLFTEYVENIPPLERTPETNRTLLNIASFQALILKNFKSGDSRSPSIKAGNDEVQK